MANKEICAPCTYKDIYNETITAAQTADRFDCAARLLIDASDHIKSGNPIPEPLATYIAQVLDDVATAAMTKGAAQQRNSNIVKALNLSWLSGNEGAKFWRV